MTSSARRIVVTGRVQGVGYRPFVYVTAQKLGLTGSVLNGSGKVFIHAEGTAEALDQLERALVESAPPLARPHLADSSVAESTGATEFSILASSDTGDAEIHVPPDLYTCDDCVAELTTPAERRFGYPFINCTQCGPRYTIITAMPYDRPNTSMAAFPLCDDCRQEYESPLDRRFHAQPLACPKCGPQLSYTLSEHAAHDDYVGACLAREAEPETRDVGACLAREAEPKTRDVGACLAREAEPKTCDVGARLAREAEPETSDVGACLAREDQPETHDVGACLAREDQPEVRDAREEKPNRAQSTLLQAVEALKRGSIIAVKGVGGYHLVCDAANDKVIALLRERKHRPHKPLAVMFPLAGDDGLEKVRESLQLDELTTQTLLDPSRPIVLVKKHTDFSLGQNLAPGLNELGAFLPYSPLHHQLLKAFGKPIVATSGNISGEPVITDETEVESRLAQVADAFLHHNRPIVRPADDPVVRPIAGKARAIRLGRGTAPVERALPSKIERPTLAVGGHMKVTIALAWDWRVVISPHVGELDSRRSHEVFTQVISDIQGLYDVNSQAIVCDLHPGYASTRWTASQGLPVIKVQHHAAHASALAGEHPDVDKWLVFTWDGVGYGSDGTLWGGEALAGRPGNWIRKASFRPFKLAGGDQAGRQPWRSAAALLWENAPVGGRLAGDDYFHALERATNHHAFDPNSLQLTHTAWQKNINTHSTSAVGRLFDAAAALVLGRHVASFEGQGPMELEQVVSGEFDPVSLPLTADQEGVLHADWAPLLPMLQDQTIATADRAARFHASMARALVDQAIKVRKTYPFDAVGLSGGVFQNRVLTELVFEMLTEQGIEVRLHTEIPANDGGLSFGQIIEALNP